MIPSPTGEATRRDLSDLVHAAWCASAAWPPLLPGDAVSG